MERKRLPFAVVRNLRQILVHQFDAPTVEERPVARDRHQHRPTAVIRYPDDPVVPRHDASSSASALRTLSGRRYQGNPLDVTAFRPGVRLFGVACTITQQ